MTRYEWRNHQPAGGVPADVAGAELERIEAEHGAITPAAVVDASKAKRAPLHRCFEWDNDKAAAAHRLQQARLVINHLSIVVSEPDAKPIATRAFVIVNESDDDERGYVSTERAMADPVLRAEVLARALRELRSIERRYKDLRELSAVFEAVRLVAA